MKLNREHDHKLPTGALGLAITPDGARAFAACADGAIYGVDTASGKAEAFEEKHASYASGCVLLPDGKTLISGGYDGQLVWHDVETRKRLRKVQAHQFWSWQLAMSPDGALRDTHSGTVWDARGRYKRGPIESDLEKVAISDEYWFSWKAFHPLSELIRL